MESRMRGHHACPVWGEGEHRTEESLYGVSVPTPRDYVLNRMLR